MTTQQSLPVAVIGAGPVGLAAAAHLAARKTPFIVFEAGSSVGENLAGYGTFAFSRLGGSTRTGRQ